jgi:hypothetical protein
VRGTIEQVDGAVLVVTALRASTSPRKRGEVKNDG